MVQMQSFPEEVAIRHANGRYLSSLLRDIGGIEPLPDDRRITQRGYYFYIMKYDAEHFEGLPRDRFVEALNEDPEGALKEIGIEPTDEVLDALEDSFGSIHELIEAFVGKRAVG